VTVDVAVRRNIVKVTLRSDAAEHDGQISGRESDAGQVIEGYVHKGAQGDDGIGAGYGVQKRAACE